MATTKTKTHNPIVNSNERLKEVGNNVGKVARDEAAESGKTFLKQLLNLDLASSSPATHEEKPPEPQKTTSGIELIDIITFSKPTTEKKKSHTEKAPRIEASMNYSRDIEKSGERASKGEIREMSRDIKEIQAELKQLLSSSKVLQMEFAEVAVGQTTPTVGKYQLTFFAWMLGVIREARRKVEDSGAWLNTVKGKGAKKGYWGMSKKHGTSFSMSNERQVATQVG